MDRGAWRSVVHGVTESDMSTDVQASIYWIGQKVHSIFFHKILQKNPYKVTFWPTQYLCIYLSTIYLSTHAYLQHTYTHNLNKACWLHLQIDPQSLTFSWLAPVPSKSAICLLVSTGASCLISAHLHSPLTVLTPQPEQPPKTKVNVFPSWLQGCERSSAPSESPPASTRRKSRPHSCSHPFLSSFLPFLSLPCLPVQGPAAPGALHLLVPFLKCLSLVICLVHPLAPCRPPQSQSQRKTPPLCP